MKFFYKYLLFLFVSILFTFRGSAQNDYFKLEKNRKRIIIPFKFINKAIIIPLTINNSDSLYFLLDTGLKKTLITELSQEDSLQLNNTRKKLVKGLGGNKTLSVLISYHNKINLKGIEGYNQQINIMEEDIFSLSERTGHKINGIIGYDFLKNFIFKIDYRKRELTFYDPRYYRKKLQSYIHFPLEINSGKPYIEADIIAPDNKRKKLKLLIDTGALLSFWVVDNNNIHIPKPDTTIYSYIGEGLSGSVYGEYGRIPQLILKNKKLNNIVTAYPNFEDISEVLHDGRNGAIGNEILRRFYIVIDYSNKRLFLKPNYYFKQPFLFNQSGIIVYQPDLKLPFYKILSVRDNSPAAKGGLKINDLLLEINKQNVMKMSLQKIINVLEKFGNKKNKRNKEVELLILRKDSLLNIKYRLPEIPF